MRLPGRKTALFCLVLTGTLACLNLHPANSRAAPASDLQSWIDRAKPGDTVTIPAGIYEGAVVIPKPLTIQASGEVRIVAKGEQPAVWIQSDNVRIQDLTVEDRRQQPDLIAVLVNGSGNQLRNLHIVADGKGLKLDGAHRNRIENIRIEGSHKSDSDPSSFLTQGNGIDLWGSHENVIVGSRISGVQDGIYVENSDSTQILQNQVTGSRYAFHMMFTHNTVIRANESVRNAVGAMIMGTDKTEVMENRFYKSDAHVHSQGILLFDAKNTLVAKNRIEGNRLGLYVEQSADNEIVENDIVQNFMGIQMLNSHDNHLYLNNFMSNVIQAQAEDSSNNRVHENYWDDHRGIDMSGTGRSSLPYRADPFFLTITTAVPSFQLFFDSPGMFVLQGLFKSDTKNWLTDESPLINPVSPPADAAGGGDRAVWLASAFLLLVSAIPFAIPFLKKGAVQK